MKEGRGWLAALLIASAVILFFRLGVPPVRLSTELRCWGVLEAMVESGDLWVPRLGGDPRINKPPLYYWATYATALLAGEVTPAALRLPAAVCALALVALTYAWGCRIGGNAYGMFAAMLLVTMKWFVVLGRRGVAEMPLALFCTAALFSYERLRTTRRAGFLPVFAACLTLALLAKATAALLVIGLPIAVDLIARGGLRAALRPKVLGWVGAALAAGFAWYGVVLARVPGAWDVLKMALLLPFGVASDSAPTMSRHDHPSVFHYLTLLPSVALPGLLLFPFVLLRAWQTRLWRGDAARRFPALAFASLFVAFSLLSQKQRHYLLPLLPLLALLLADPVAWVVANRPEAVRRLLRVLGPAAAVVGALLLAGLTALYVGLLEAPVLQLLVLISLGAAAVAGCLVAGLRGQAVAFATCCALGWLGLTALVRLDHDLHRDLDQHGELATRTDPAARRWVRAFDRIERLEARWRQ